MRVTARVKRAENRRKEREKNSAFCSQRWIVTPNGCVLDVHPLRDSVGGMVVACKLEEGSVKMLLQLTPRKQAPWDLVEVEVLGGVFLEDVELKKWHKGEQLETEEVLRIVYRCYAHLLDAAERYDVSKGNEGRPTRNWVAKMWQVGSLGRFVVEESTE